MLDIQKYRDFLQIDPGQDEDLEDLKAEVEALWVKETQRPWKAQSGRVETQRLIGNRITTIFLQLTPVTTIIKVEIKDEGSSADWEELLIANLGWELHNNQLIRNGTWWKSLIRITYDAGYATNACPADVKRALKIQAKFTRQRMDGEIVISSQGFKGGQGTFVDPDMHKYFAKRVIAHRDLV